MVNMVHRLGSRREVLGQRGYQIQKRRNKHCMQRGTSFSFLILMVCKKTLQG